MFNTQFVVVNQNTNLKKKRPNNRHVLPTAPSPISVNLIDFPNAMKASDEN